MSNTTDKMFNRYVYLHLDCGTTISVKLDDEGVVVEAWSDDTEIATTWKTYNEMGVEVKEKEIGMMDYPAFTSWNPKTNQEQASASSRKD